MDYSHVSFLGELDFSELFSLGHHVLILDTHNTTAPLSEEVPVLVVLGREVSLESSQVLQVFLYDLGQCNTGGGLGVAKLSKSCFSTDDAEWNVLGSAESWEEGHHLKWLNIMGNNNELSFAFFDEVGDMIEAEFKMNWFWSYVVGLVSSFSSLGFSLKSVLLLLSALWRVLSQKLKKSGRLILIDGLSELVQGRW